MTGRFSSPVQDRLEMVRLRTEEGLTRAQAAQALGFSLEWVRKWSRRYRKGGAAALVSPPVPAPGPLAEFSRPVVEALLAYRRTHPRIGARRALAVLRRDPSLSGERWPNARTIHRAWVHAGLVSRRLPREQPPTAPVPALTDPHAVWQMDHQDHLRVHGLAELLVLQSIRAPAAGLTIGGDIFLGPHGAHAVPEQALFDALRRRMAQWGRPQIMAVDGGIRFLGQSQRTFPSRFEMLCAGWDIAVHQIRSSRPTDNGAVERLHQTLDGMLLGPVYAGLDAAQCALEEHVTLLNEAFPSRAKTCDGRPPLVAHPAARHSGRPYDPRCEWETFNMSSVDAMLTSWKWHRQANAKTAQISFANKNVRIGGDHKGKTVALRFDPTDRQVVVYQLGTGPDQLGPEIRRFHCAAFDKGTILSTSKVAPRPISDWGGTVS